MSTVARMPLAAKTAVQGVIFDMDGVIVDSHPSHRKAWHQFLQSVGKDVSERELDFILDGRKRHEILRHFLGELSDDELAEYGNRKDEFFQQALSNVKSVPGVIDFVRELKKCRIPLALATSGSKRRAQFTLRRLQLTDYFQAVITGNDVAEGKPDPAIYCVACEQLDVPSERVLAFEDAVSGVHAARAAGIQCVGVGETEQAEKLRQAGAAHVIQSFVGFTVRECETILVNHGNHANRT
ncbi:MAG TPA: HAD family phosphatase [Terriglobales bacterium]